MTGPRPWAGVWVQPKDGETLPEFLKRCEKAYDRARCPNVDSYFRKRCELMKDHEGFHGTFDGKWWK